MIHRYPRYRNKQALVVNCFQNTTLVDDSQAVDTENFGSSVVNCFQNTTLVDDSQGMVLNIAKAHCCELLSEYYFSR